ncbi:glutathione S-transferase family protein [Dongia sedimenti]|uniref:Glutathione S-transferase family protein n=1 Tax=Dongia sedimenti TaxID=3064282 RepID=A0ABU0YP29_9PROT|nr:glutathione S-transferase family protein [Rhodospirillaceae bacterium R-7]
MLKFFFGPQSCALASHIALEEAGADYEAVRLDLKAGDQRKPDYLKVNPKGRVPALVTDRGVLTENPAILAFIAQTHPEKKLAPLDDAYAFGRIQAFNAYLCATVHVAHAHKLRGYRWADEQSSFDDMKRKVPETVAACFELIENELLEGPWVAGAGFSIADPYLFTLSSWLEGDGVDPKRFPKVLDHRNRMAERPAVQKVLPLHS